MATNKKSVNFRSGSEKDSLDEPSKRRGILSKRKEIETQVEEPKNSKHMNYSQETIELQEEPTKLVMIRYNALHKTLREAEHENKKLRKELGNRKQLDNAEDDPGCSSQATSASSLTPQEQKHLEILRQYAGTCEDLKLRLGLGGSSHDSSKEASTHAEFRADDSSKEAFTDAEFGADDWFGKFGDFVENFDAFDESEHRAAAQQKQVRQAIQTTLQASFFKEIDKQARLYQQDMSSGDRRKAFDLDLMDPGQRPFPQASNAHRNLFSTRGDSNCAITSKRVQPKSMQMIRMTLNKDTTRQFLRYISWHLLEKSDLVSFVESLKSEPPLSHLLCLMPASGIPKHITKAEDLDDIAKWPANDELNNKFLHELIEYKTDGIQTMIHDKRELLLYLPEHCTECMLHPFFEFDAKGNKVMEAHSCCNLEYQTRFTGNSEVCQHDIIENYQRQNNNTLRSALEAEIIAHIEDKWLEIKQTHCTGIPNLRGTYSKQWYDFLHNPAWTKDNELGEHLRTEWKKVMRDHNLIYNTATGKNVVLFISYSEFYDAMQEHAKHPKSITLGQLLEHSMKSKRSLNYTKLSIFDRFGQILDTRGIVLTNMACCYQNTCTKYFRHTILCILQKLKRDDLVTVFREMSLSNTVQLETALSSYDFEIHDLMCESIQLAVDKTQTFHLLIDEHTPEDQEICNGVQQLAHAWFVVYKEQWVKKALKYFDAFETEFFSTISCWNKTVPAENANFEKWKQRFVNAFCDYIFTFFEPDEADSEYWQQDTTQARVRAFKNLFKMKPKPEVGNIVSALISSAQDKQLDLHEGHKYRFYFPYENILHWITLALLDDTNGILNKSCSRFWKKEPDNVFHLLNSLLAMKRQVNDDPDADKQNKWVFDECCPLYQYVQDNSVETILPHPSATTEKDSDNSEGNSNGSGGSEGNGDENTGNSNGSGGSEGNGDDNTGNSNGSEGSQGNGDGDDDGGNSAEDMDLDSNEHVQTGSADVASLLNSSPDANANVQQGSIVQQLGEMTKNLSEATDHATQLIDKFEEMNNNIHVPKFWCWCSEELSKCEENIHTLSGNTTTKARKQKLEQLVKWSDVLKTLINQVNPGQVEGQMEASKMTNETSSPSLSFNSSSSEASSLYGMNHDILLSSPRTAFLGPDVPNPMSHL